MERTPTRSADGTTPTEQPDTGFYLPGMASPLTGRGRVARFFANLVRRRGVLPADLLLTSDTTVDPQQREN